MLGSAFSIACPNFIINTIVAEVLSGFADQLEKSKNPKDFTKDLEALIKKTIKEHKRIIYNGNNYCDEWMEEAKQRGLSNLENTVEALPKYLDKNNIEVLVKNGVLSEPEIYSRYEILLENYCKIIHIEALTMIDMTKKHIMPACVEYQNELVSLVQSKKNVDIDITVEMESKLLHRIGFLSSMLYEKLTELEVSIIESKESKLSKENQDNLEKAKFYRYTVFSKMSELRQEADELEAVIGKSYWNLPTYGEILYSV